MDACFLGGRLAGGCGHCAPRGILCKTVCGGAKMRRRDVVVGLGALVSHEAGAATMPWLSPDLPDGTRAEAHLVQVAGKQPLIQLSDRPPNLETPIQAFRTAITPNNQFFVRYPLASIPDANNLHHSK